jgi:hypothetical protein
MVAVGSDRYRYMVRETTPAAGDIVPLIITIQHDSENGAVLRVAGLTATRVPVDESKWYDGRTLARPIKPRQIVGLIVRAKQVGWVPDSPGPPFDMEVHNDDVFEPDVPA